uniref:Transposon protein, putative, CACTA, En/Spm sub-class n=1 Tax=Tanacetum cinerariifolium TaxID=118510 RepID=A0A6L2L0A0_TANCI|nr:transposon protein, putative, CACTA, En/Spm sub-class [Tanacetum cinerariifolium]
MVVLEKDLEISKNKKEKNKSLALKARKVLSEEEASSSDSNDEEYAMAVRLKVKLEPDEWIKDNVCSRHMTDNKDLFSSYKTMDKGNVVFGSNTKSKIVRKGVFHGYLPNSKAYIVLNNGIMRIEESLNVKFDESPPPKSPPLVDDDVLECKIIENQEKDLEIKANEPLNKEIINIKESKDHPTETIIDLPPKTTNPSPPRPSFDSIERLANEPPPLPTMKPPLPPLPPQLHTFPLNPPSNFPPLSPLGPNNPFLLLTPEMICEYGQRAQVVVDNLRDEM